MMQQTSTKKSWISAREAPLEKGTEHIPLFCRKTNTGFHILKACYYRRAESVGVQMALQKKKKKTGRTEKKI
jgi:hypothetical protein